MREDGFSEQTGAGAANHMRETEMESPRYTLQIKVKPCKCFSTHFSRDPDTAAVCSPVKCLKIEMCAVCERNVNTRGIRGGGGYLKILISLSINGLNFDWNYSIVCCDVAVTIKDHSDSSLHPFWVFVP